MRRAQTSGHLSRLAMKYDGGTFSLRANHLYVPPPDSVIPPSSEGFHRCFFCGETPGIAFIEIRFGLAIANLRVGENTTQETVAVLVNCLTDSRYLGDIDPGSDDHGLNLAQLFNLAVLLKEHAIAVRVEAVFSGNGVLVGIEH